MSVPDYQTLMLPTLRLAFFQSPPPSWPVSYQSLIAIT
ncbi:hypothetical protein Rleg4DRAFT_7698 [Rhizobium leguminosarum bv. trifolii WSM2297]|uniref:Uncharacterized protein n=1 Tax=Rhizobium leguminosarum bv. trifolii WSM2297 TaxID=754762 RepID=J0WIF2_RHILT|nr:hypothetical protein Rleg4DRAFT_7194 [Rhizobium leguminosarum bv. trifolii WSM2297]EJC85801.1 hypothetical protein Rleg4DRAFT_7698 [Rhizobium leguminosarum bv. trifolii WSM2297]